MGLYLEFPALDRDFPMRSFTNEGGVIVYPHWHKEMELIYVMEGRLNLGVNDVPIQMEQGEIYVINGGDVHYFLASPNSERIVLQFDLAVFQEFSLTEDEGKRLRDLFLHVSPSSVNWDSDVAQRMAKILQVIHLESSQRKLGYRYVVKAKLYEMLSILERYVPRLMRDSREDATSKSQETLEKLQQIFAYVEEHYQETITLQQVADYVGFSSYYFTKLFKRNMGITFMTFVNDYRLSKAKWILLNEETPVTEVAELAGFSSVKTFHHAFKRAMGVSPLKYRRTIFGNK
ncbi:helix-turn-helix domain-containing protein [Listeria rocourtiae]|uniref:AraC family transcriptional regulator n=2 Tax=Listeria rocourtiae TaxID=647910 RepID=A0A4R6ZQA4_9LIST|nr:AraC family transcriptional regulator [Listeria rocourtiae]EUJ44157.1 AraC family transcriptional regulator [Listeria rocourtiae FSL F6-920]MBC1435758.1 helix-turn-helix domain-containing protein [Listeria rocourtiae]MBC1604068.1 helix-turn-helix domain-containing protein [Listeria rocourtiae]TDR54582.1 AraC family transcriptional regulator [Listeria rocourtiae]